MYRTFGAIIPIALVLLASIACNPITPTATPAPGDTVHTVIDPVGNAYQPCEHEYGQGPDGTYPCMWDADTMGNGMRGAHTPRYTVWARSEDGCPIVADVDERCVYAVEWSADAGD